MGHFIESTNQPVKFGFKKSVFEITKYLLELSYLNFIT